MNTYITELFKASQLQTGARIGYVNILENGIGTSRIKAKQVKIEELILGLKLRDDLILEQRLHSNSNHCLEQIQLRPSIAVWNKPTQQLTELIKKHNIAYAINIMRIPEISAGDGKNLLQEYYQKLATYKEKNKVMKLLEETIFQKKDINNEDLFKLIIGKKYRINGAIRGFVAEVMSKYIISQKLPNHIKLINNLDIKYDYVVIDGEKKYLGHPKEFDFALTGIEVKPFKQFLANLQENNIEVIKNKQYVPNIINKL